MEFSHELALALVQSHKPFPVDFEQAWRWIGYSTKQKAKNKLTNNFEEEIDFLTEWLKTPTGGRPSESLWLSVDCFKSLGMMAGTQKGKEIRRYFLECERIAKQAAEVIPAQSDRIRELELQNQNLALQLQLTQTQERLMHTTQAIAGMHGSGMVALILGKPEAVIERVTEVEKTVLCNERGQPIKTYKGLSKTKLAKRYGMKKASDVENWLKSIGKADVLQPAITAAPCQYVPFEFVPELDRLWASRLGVRQRLLGE